MPSPIADKLAPGLLIFAMILAAALVAGCYDDPFFPKPPDYMFRARVSGLEGFTADNGTAVIMLPLPAWNGTPVREAGARPIHGIWDMGYYENDTVRYHGTARVSVENTTLGPMLAVRIGMTDYYEVYARPTPVAILPGQKVTPLPTPVPERRQKNLSFDDVRLADGGFAGPWESPGSGKLQSRQDVLRFIETPLLPAENLSGTGNYTTYAYIDDSLRPLNNSSRINVLVRLRVTLNHNFANASVEGTRQFEYHDYTVNESIPAGTTGLVPLRVEYAYHTSPHYESLT